MTMFNKKRRAEIKKKPVFGMIEDVKKKPIFNGFPILFFPHGIWQKAFLINLKKVPVKRPLKP